MTRTRREPPAFRRIEVRRVERLSPRMVRVTFGGAELDGFAVEQPAARVRLLLPSRVADELVMPTWNGNEFLLPDGSRPAIRTFTPLRVDPDALEIDLQIVVHGGGVASGWADAADSGAQAALSGPGRGYTIDSDAPAFLLAGDETAIPAVGQLLGEIPADAKVDVHIEVAHPDARLAMPEHPGATIEWHELPDHATPGDTLHDAIRGADVSADARVWVAGEAAGVHRIRKHLFEERELSRRQASVRGYWKHGRAGGDEDDS